MSVTTPTVTTPTVTASTYGTRPSSLRRSTMVVGLGAAAVTTAVAAPSTPPVSRSGWTAR